MARNILYVACARDLATQELLKQKKIGIAGHTASKRIRQLNSTEMPIAVELVGAWSFERVALSADQVEKAAHYLLAPYNVNGEWFEDPDDDLADRVGKYAERLGGFPVGDETPQLVEMNDKQRAELAKMERVFEPIAEELDAAGVSWEYMTWKVGMDSPYGRLNISVRESGDLYIRLHARDEEAMQQVIATGVDWRLGADRRCLANLTPSQLVDFVTS